MKLQGETTTNMREPSKTLFFPVLRKSRVAPEQNGGTLSGRHLECEEGTYDRGIISRILRKVGALSSGESTFFRTRTYSPQRRSKSQERGSTALPIKPFSNREALPVLRNFKNVPTTQSYRRMDSCDTRRLSQPNVLPSGALQLATQKVEDKSKNKPRNSDDLPRKQSPVCAKDIKHSPAVPTKLKPVNNKCSTSEVASVFPESVQLKENSAAEPSEQLEKEVKKDANKPSLHEDGSKNEKGVKEVKEVRVSNVETLNGVTRIQVKYSAPTQQEIKRPTDNFEIPSKNAVVEVKLDSYAKAAQNENSKEIISKDIISESVNFSGFRHSAVATNDASKPNEPSTSSSSSSPTAPLYASSLRSVNANKASSKSNPGRLTIRPASNLNASKLKSEYLKLTQFNDIKVGQFSAPTKPKRQLKSEEDHDDDDDLLIINETRAEGGWGNDNDDDDEEKFEFIGAGVIQGKSSLAKTKTKKQRSVNFSEVPVIHLIEDISASLAGETEENDDDDYDGSTSYPAEARGLFSSITSAASKGGLSSYKSKTLADFEFDFESPPRQSKSTSPSDARRERASEASHEEVLSWSSGGSIDLLF